MVQLIEIYEDEKNYFIVQEAVEGRDLYEVIMQKENISEKDV